MISLVRMSEEWIKMYYATRIKPNEKKQRRYRPSNIK